jgi:hypothetical protein
VGLCIFSGKIRYGPEGQNAEPRSVEAAVALYVDCRCLLSLAHQHDDAGLMMGWNDDACRQPLRSQPGLRFPIL